METLYATNNEPLYFDAFVINRGGALAKKVVVQFTIPNGITYVSSAGSGTFGASNSKWVIGKIEAGSAAHIRLCIKVADVNVLPLDITWVITSVIGTDINLLDNNAGISISASPDSEASDFSVGHIHGSVYERGKIYCSGDIVLSVTETTNVTVTLNQDGSYIGVITNLLLPWSFSWQGACDSSTFGPYTIDGKFYDQALGGVIMTSTQPILVTYDELAALAGSSGLTPFAYYKITDFRTVHYIVANGGNFLDSINTGSLEPLVVQASTVNTLFKEAKSEQYPKDTIYYSLDTSLWLQDLAFSDQTDYLNPTLVPGFKGVTILDNYCGWDFRNVKFRRWKTPSWMKVVPHNVNNNYVANSHQISDVVDVNDYVDYYTFHNYQEHRGVHLHNDYDNVNIFFNDGTILSNNVFLNYAQRIVVRTGCVDNTFLGIQDSEIYSDSVNSVLVGVDHCNIRPFGAYMYSVSNVSGISKIAAKIYNMHHVDIKYHLDGNLDLFSSTHVSGSFSKTIFMNSGGQLKLSYYDASNVLQIVDPTT